MYRRLPDEGGVMEWLLGLMAWRWWYSDDGPVGWARQADQPNPLRDSEQVVGRITQAGSWDRRYRPTYAPPEPIEVNPFREVAEIIGGTVLMCALFVGIYFLAAVAAVAQ
jgi:hypothetical protein